MKLVASWWMKGRKYGTFQFDSGDFVTEVIEVSERQLAKELRRANKKPIVPFDFSKAWRETIKK